MKKYFLLLTFVFFSQFAFCQSSGKYFSGTLEPGSKPNSVYIVIKSNTTISGAKISSFQFELGIPTSSIGIRPGFTIDNSKYSAISYATDGSTEKQDGMDYYGFGFSGDGSQGSSASFDFTAGVEYIIAEVFFTDNTTGKVQVNPSITSQIRMMQLPDGGSTTHVNFYLADRGFDVTNTTAQFYGGSTFSNDGKGYGGSSYVFITSVTLPVKLSSFTVISKNNDALLSWSVENQEATASHFEIERSANGTDFSQVGTVNATTNQQESYSYTDAKSNLSGTTYYRLKMVDKDGQFAYSDIKSVHFGNAAFAVSLYPNPVQNLTKLKVTLDQTQVIKVSVNNALGNLVQQFEITGQKGINEKSIDLSSVPAGSYMIRIEAGQNRKTMSVIKN